MKGKAQYNHEGYRDLVAYQAIKNLEQGTRLEQERNRKRNRNSQRRGRAR